MQSLIYAVIDVIHIGVNILTVAIIARAVLSWVQPNPYHPVIRFLHKITNPILEPFQRIIPSIGGIDISPIAALFALQFGEKLITGGLYQLLQ